MELGRLRGPERARLPELERVRLVAPELEVLALEPVARQLVLKARTLELEERVPVLVVKRLRPRGFQPLGVEATPASALVTWARGTGT